MLEKLKEIFSEKIKSSQIIDNKLNIFIEKENLISIIKYLKENLEFDYLISVSCVDFVENFQLIYHLYSFVKKEYLVLKVNLSKENPEISSITSIYEGANWQEREIYDLFGINFINHPNLRRILLPDEWLGHPLRKDYVKQTPDLKLI